VTNFQKNWAKPPTPSLGERFNDAIKPKGSLKPRVEAAITRLRKQITKLDGMTSKLAERDAKLFQRIIAATQQHDTQTSRVLSNELAEVRKVSRVLGNARISLEQIELRLTTAHDLGDTVVTIMPTIGLMRNMKSSLVKFMPNADQEISRMAEMLGGLATETFSSDASFGVDETLNSESEKILQEAGAVAETSLNDRLPTMPAETQSTSTSYTTKYL
jgi:division protein CdvB (Snf7/Vps24/ESCRT-III family)